MNWKLEESGDVANTIFLNLPWNLLCSTSSSYSKRLMEVRKSLVSRELNINRLFI